LVKTCTGCFDGFALKRKKKGRKAYNRMRREIISVSLVICPKLSTQI
jgi:hypothetical protein